MHTTITPKIDYFRRCYRADNNELSLSDIFRIRQDRRQVIDGEECLASGTLPRLPMAPEKAAALHKQADTYRSERRLIYALFMVRGDNPNASGFNPRKPLNAPLLYFPAELIFDQDWYLEIDQYDLQFNTPILQQLIKPDCSETAIESLPEIRFPFDLQQLTLLVEWLRKNTDVTNLEEIGRWPNLQHNSPQRGKRNPLSLNLSAAVLLVDRPRGSRGVLHELYRLANQGDFSTPLQSLLGGVNGTVRRTPSQLTSLPGLYSPAQCRAIANAAALPLSLISGPPGTGKSFTIAAIAIEHMLREQPVLIISKTTQAVEVIGEKLRREFGLETGLVTCDERNYHASLARFLDNLLQLGVSRKDSLEGLRRQVHQQRKQIIRLERQIHKAFVVAKNTSNSWFHRLARKWSFALWGEYGLWDKLANLEAAQEVIDKNAIDCLNATRAQQISRALQRNRDQLVRFRRALASRNSKTQSERFAEVDFTQVLATFPIWLSTPQEIHKSLPLQKNLFSLVIMDEASQCDIASAIPALQRARRAVIVGDGKQLRHVSFLSLKQQTSFWHDALPGLSAHELVPYRDYSILDLAHENATTQEQVTLLDEHFRSKPALIGFANHRFYDNRLHIMQTQAPTEVVPLTFTPVAGKRLSNGSNRIECDAALAYIQAHIEQFKHSSIKPSLGVLSPFRDQADYLEKTIINTLDLNDLKDYQIKVATPYGFQGDERDCMVLSMCLDNASLRAANYLNREDMFNVSITRGKSSQVIFYSMDMDQLPNNNLLKQYWLHAQREPARRAPNAIGCEFLEEVKTALQSHGIKTHEGLPLAGLKIDLVCSKNQQLVGLDLIGQAGELGDFFELQDYKRFARAGIRVIPLPTYHWRKDKNFLINKIEQALQT